MKLTLVKCKALDSSTALAASIANLLVHPSQCPTPCAIPVRMRRRRRGYYWQESIPEFEEVAGFGGARIMRDLRGKVHIQGGTDTERKQAHDWMLRFLSPETQPRSQR